MIEGQSEHLSKSRSRRLVRKALICGLPEAIVDESCLLILMTAVKTHHIPIKTYSAGAARAISVKYVVQVLCYRQLAVPSGKVLYYGVLLVT